MNTALDSCTPLVRAPGLTWPNRCSAFSFGERWRDSMSMMWRSSKTGFGTQSRGGIVTLRLSSGEASGMPAATGPMRVVIGRVDQGLPPRMCCRDAFVPCAITNGSAMPSQMASDPLVMARPDLAQEFEEILQRFSKLLTKQELEQLRTVPFLQSSQGSLASPASLYLRTPHNVACLGDDAMFVAGSRTALYKRLGCMEQPKVEDILSYLSRLRLQGNKPNQPEILYPALVEALKTGKHSPLGYLNQPIVWDGKEFSKPGDILLGNKYRSIFLKAVPLLEEASPALHQALKSLGVPSEPQPQHWRKLFVWFHQRYAPSGEPLTQPERRALHQAYSYLSEMPKEVTADTKCLLDQDRRLHSSAERRAMLYLHNDDPALAQAGREK